MKNIAISKNLLSALIIICMIAVPVISYGGNIVVKPGKFDHFAILLPEKIRAGEGSTIRLQAYDAYDNLITDFGGTGKDFNISVSGSAHVQPPILKASSFTGGATGITITDKKAESVVVSVFETGGTVPVMTKEIVISPNKLDNFFVQSPQSVTAGTSFDIRIIARDAFDNPITYSDLESKNIKITSSGMANFKVVNGAEFKNGVGIAALVAEKVGEVIVEVQDTVTSSKGKSPAIKVTPSVLSHFKVYAPKEAAAGEAFGITISALDAFDNLVDNYSSYGGGINITTTGRVRPSPYFIGQSEFRNGQAIVKLRYDKAEEISVIATENNKTQQGKSTPIIITPSAPDNFVVVTPDAAVAGQRFRIKIEAYDRFNNMVKNYNFVGNDVNLNATGTGVLSPKTLSAAEFIDGIASVDVVYDRAESFAISASMSARKEEKITVKKQKEEVKTPEAAKVPEMIPTPAKTEKAEARKEEKVVLKKEKAVQEQIIPKEEKAAVKKAEKAEKKETVKEKKETVKEKKADEKFFEIKKVSIIEAKNKAMVIVNMKAPDGDTKYQHESESVSGGDWIKIKLKPVVNKTKKLWKFKSAFVKEIRIEEGKAPADVDIRVDLLSKQFTFDVSRVKDSLVISISNP